ncbi:winged helix-turn-helix domain-containing protein [Neorhizobium sp. T25_27]|uniref:winged helix-turn-helix domain-containing protein n=1 Tax=Neorhizobium sp. T25_27 TaxID=2093831 RepID=UPI000CF849B2|nr:winged helix-turn-helix domain-containing protein [Neorhizobium sp. T25_27]
MKHIVVLESDDAARGDLADYLMRQNFRVTQLSEHLHLRQILSREIIDAVLIDVKSEEDIGLVKDISRLIDAPVLLLSTNRTSEDERVRGLEAGAADYLCRPFGYRELSARLNVALRQKFNPRIERQRRSYKFCDYELTVQSRIVTRSDAHTVKLTTAEFNLLTAFLNQPRQVLTREELVSASRVHAGEIYDRSLDALILRLRRKIEIDAVTPRLILTERGVGYKLECDVQFDERPKIKR